MVLASHWTTGEGGFHYTVILAVLPYLLFGIAAWLLYRAWRRGPSEGEGGG